MGKWFFVLAALVAIVSPAGADEGAPEISVGYSFLKYLEDGGGTTPVGIYASAAWGDGSTLLDLDAGYHRESGFGLTLHTFTLALGPRWRVRSDTAGPFVHALGGLRYDSIESESNVAFGGIAGGGIDFPAGGALTVRLGADFQIFFDEGENLKTLRLNVGLTF